MDNYKIGKIRVVKWINEGGIPVVSLLQKKFTKLLYEDILTGTLVPNEKIISIYDLSEEKEFKDKKFAKRSELYDYVISKNTELNKIKIINSDEKILKEATLKFFPEDGAWTSDLFSRPTKLNKNFLPCNLQNDMWLAQMLKRDQNLFSIGINRVLSFVKHSEFFSKEKEKYQLRIVKWQIKWMLGGGDNWIVYNGDIDFANFSDKYDIIFREGILRTLKAIGMDESVIEKGIEIYSYMWRDKVMEQTFRNIYYPIFDSGDFILYTLDDGNPVKRETKEAVSDASEELKRTWLRLRKYDYYQNHKDSIDKYGDKTNDLDMESTKASLLRSKLIQMDKERLDYLKSYEAKQRNYHRK